MKYYGIIGKSTETTDERKHPVLPTGYIQMREPRPTPEHIATLYPRKKLGDWVLPQVIEDEKQNAE